MPNALQPADEQLMLRLKNGDMAAFEVLYNRYHKRLFYYIRRFVKKTDMAEDILQETFLRILKYRKGYRKKYRFSTYLFTIGRNLCFDTLKSWENRHLDGDRVNILEQTGDTRQDPLNTLENNERQQILQKAVNDLPYDQKEILVLSKYSGLTYEEIAQIVESTPAAVKQKAYRALLALKRKLKSYRV